MKLPAFDYACPTTLAETVSLLASSNGDARLLAGGQSLMPMMAFRIASPSLVIDMRKLPGLDRIEIGTDGVRLGAMVRYRDILGDARLRTAHPLLVAAIGHVAHYQIRNRGTVGGSIAHADPAAETPGILVACDAEITVLGEAGKRIVAADDFFIAPLTTALEPGEMITQIRLPAWPAGRRWGFEEFSRRRGDFAMAGAAVFLDRDSAGRIENTHIGVIGMGDRAVRLPAAETILDGVMSVDDALLAKVEKTVAASVDPFDDIHSSAAYRRSLAGTMVKRALKSALA